MNAGSGKHSDPGQPRVLIVEDDEAQHELLCEELTDSGMSVRGTQTAEEGLALLDSFSPELVLCDIRLPGMDGLSFLEKVKQTRSSPSVVLITAFGTVSQAVQALKAGADDFLTKPLDLEHLMVSLRRVLERRRLEEEVAGLRALIDDGSFHGLLGVSTSMHELFAQIRQVSSGHGPVVVVGESGTGKELVARAIHQESSRREGPHIVVNCAGIPAQLLESEFFGHAAGAFTGADRARRGLIAEAEGGTLLLDEISEMPLELQAKLLRVLQEGRVRPVGANREVEVDVRIIAATNRDLEEEVRAGRFREDLFYRLETFMLRVPPLRERADDIELLAGRFVHRFRVALHKDVRAISSDAIRVLRNYPFPGNVRELQNAIERAVTFCEGRTIVVRDLPVRVRAGKAKGLQGGLGGQAESSRGNERSPAAMGQAGGDGALAGALCEIITDGDVLPTLAELEDWYIRFVLERAGGNKRRAAALLGIARRTLYRQLDS